MGLKDFVRSVTRDIEQAPFERIVLVGHSLAGVVIPAVASCVPERIAHLVFISCAVPPEGKAVVDTLPFGLQAYARWRFQRGGVATLPARLAQWFFCNDMDETKARLVLDQLCRDAGRLITESASRQFLPETLPRTYVMLLRDRVFSVGNQRRQIANLGPCDVVAVDAGHDAFISHPRPLSMILNGIALARDVPG